MPKNLLDKQCESRSESSWALELSVSSRMSLVAIYYTQCKLRLVFSQYLCLYVEKIIRVQCWVRVFCRERSAILGTFLSMTSFPAGWDNLKSFLKSSVIFLPNTLLISRVHFEKSSNDLDRVPSAPLAVLNESRKNVSSTISPGIPWSNNFQIWICMEYQLAEASG